MKLEVKEIKPVDPPKEYILTLNQNELDLIAAILGKTGGYDGPKGWRELLNTMHYELRAKAKITYGILNQSNSLFPSRERVVPEV